jgi:hypoxanthine-DNA glycosylase
MSLEQQEYYAHPRNAFWLIMGALFDAGREISYARRTRQLAGNGIAVWDVLRTTERRGSLDSAIVKKASEANDFEGFFDNYPTIHTICFNGRTSEHLYQGLVKIGDSDRYHFLSLPSTSPAHAAMSFAEKLNRWTAVKEATMQ